MNEYQFRAVCAACDDVLHASESSLERHSIQWLHVIREHQLFLRQYEFLFSERTGIFGAIVEYSACLLKRYLWGMRQFFRGLSRVKGFVSPIGLPERADFLFVSHLVNSSHVGSKTDFYFGALPSELARRGAVVVVAQINHTTRDFSVSEQTVVEGRLVHVVLPSALDRFDEHQIVNQLRAESRRLRDLANKIRAGLESAVALHASFEALSGATRTAMRIGLQVAELAKRLNVGRVLFTFEGHAWERAVCASVKRALPESRCTAFQHAALFRYQHAIRRPLHPDFMPDQVLTSSDFSRDQLTSVFSEAQDGVLTLGSPRGLASRVLDLVDPVVREKICLVLPEGLESECAILFEFSKRCALLHPDVEFVWRVHPLTKMTRLRLKNPRLWFLPANIRLSKQSLDEDAATAKWALYRGSTAVAIPVMAGARPVYLQQGVELSFDPLFSLNEWRAVISNVDGFSKLLRETEECSSAARQARSDCQKLFPVMECHAVAETLMSVLGKK